MAKWIESTKTLVMNQDDLVHIDVEGLGLFITVGSRRDNDTDDQSLAIVEWLNDETIYENTIPAE